MKDGLESLLEAYEGLGEVIPKLQGLDALFTENTGLRKCITSLYSDILEFHAGAYQCFTQFSERGMWFSQIARVVVRSD